MKISKIILIFVGTLTMVVGAGYLYASSGIKSKPGYVVLATPTGESVNRILSIKVGPRGVRPTQWLFEKIVESSEYEQEMPERVFNSVLQELQGIQLHVYEVRNNRKVFDDAIAESATALKAKNWEPLVAVRDGKERIVVMQYGNEDLIKGLSIMASTPDTAIFLNLIGPFDIIDC